MHKLLVAIFLTMHGYGQFICNDYIAMNCFLNFFYENPIEILRNLFKLNGFPSHMFECKVYKFLDHII